MSLSTSAELLQFTKDQSGLPATNDEMTDAKWYTLLSLAQQDVFRQLVTAAPNAMRTSETLLTSSDGGYTYQIPSYPYGHVVLKNTRTGWVLLPGAEYDPNADYVLEGQTVRMTNHRVATFTDGPYAYYCSLPGDIDGSTQPTLTPSHARVLIPWRALSMWAKRGGLRDPATYDVEFRRLAWGDPQSPGDTGIIGALRKQVSTTSGGGTYRSALAGWASSGGWGI